MSLKKENVRITVAGTGYVGLSMATLLSQHHEVQAVDLVKEKVEMINARKSPIQDAEIERFFAEKELKLQATTDGEAAYRNADLVIIATPTNYDAKRNFFDTSAVEAVIDLVLKVNPKAFMVIKSTIPVGYTEHIRKEKNCNRIFFAPEFLRESKALYDNLYPSRIIVGTDPDDPDLDAAARFFAELLQEGALKEEIDTLFMGFTEAEAVKQSFRGREYNTYEATRKQRRMEPNMRARRSKVRLLEEGEADPDDIVIAKCKYQAQLDEYRELSKKFRLPEQKERIYADLKGRVAPSQVTYRKWQGGEIQREVLTERETRAVMDYIGSKSYVLNDKSRRGEQLTEDELRMRSAFTRALNKMPRYSGTLTRSLYFHDKEMLAEVLDEYQVGSVFRPSQFVSATALGELYNPDGQIQILILNSKNGADLRRFNAQEGEVVYNIASRFNVTDKIQEDGKWYIILEEA